MTETHYETLGVSKRASQDEIKKIFRELSMKYHPDLHRHHDDDDHRRACAEKFKAIANAHSVLSNPTERTGYDRRLAEERLWRQTTDHRGFGGTDQWNPRRASRSRPPVGRMVADPRYLLLGVAGLGGVALVGSLLGGLTSKRPEYHGSSLVEAWKNPATGRFEQPAPWDKEYQRLRPELVMIPREKVWKRHM
mmetsp:Transcript_6173/g.15264  ORF Transcript_6173/g.15264 Transcript_6173/m.15264 type:complete len:193 (-) Transcript_6173:414-992(-)